MIDKNNIPPLPLLMPEQWVQPSVEDLIVDNEYTVMTQQSFNLLQHYQHSIPAKIYVGKMWRKGDLLCWWRYRDSSESQISIEYRKILIV